MKFIKRRKKKLEKYSTNELVGELLTREGVDVKYASLYRDKEISVSGPAVISIVTD